MSRCSADVDILCRHSILKFGGLINKWGGEMQGFNGAEYLIYL